MLLISQTLNNVTINLFNLINTIKFQLFWFSFQNSLCFIANFQTRFILLTKFSFSMHESALGSCWTKWTDLKGISKHWNSWECQKSRIEDNWHCPGMERGRPGERKNAQSISGRFCFFEALSNAIKFNFSWQPSFLLKITRVPQEGGLVQAWESECWGVVGIH